MLHKSQLLAWSRAEEIPPSHSGSPLFPGWHAVYHRRPLTETNGNHRVTCIDRMEFDAVGLIKPIQLTHQGVPSRILDKPTDERAGNKKR